VFSLLADAVVVIHLLFIAFVVAGGLLALKWRWFAWVHVPAAAWGTLVELAGWYCPLTPLETWLRRAGGGEGYEETFIERYLIPVIYPEGLTRPVQILLGAIPLAINVIIYGIVWRRSRRGSTARGPFRGRFRNRGGGLGAGTV